MCLIQDAVRQKPIENSQSPTALTRKTLQPTPAVKKNYCLNLIHSRKCHKQHPNKSQKSFWRRSGKWHIGYHRPHDNGQRATRVIWGPSERRTHYSILRLKAQKTGPARPISTFRDWESTTWRPSNLFCFGCIAASGHAKYSNGPIFHLHCSLPEVSPSNPSWTLRG